MRTRNRKPPPPPSPSASGHILQPPAVQILSWISGKFIDDGGAERSELGAPGFDCHTWVLYVFDLALFCVLPRHSGRKKLQIKNHPTNNDDQRFTWICGCRRAPMARRGTPSRRGFTTGYPLRPTNFWNSGSSCRRSRSGSCAAQSRLPCPAAKAFLSASSASVFLPRMP
jgi:hypothetical protein